MIHEALGEGGEILHDMQTVVHALSISCRLEIPKAISSFAARLMAFAYSSDEKLVLSATRAAYLEKQLMQTSSEWWSDLNVVSAVLALQGSSLSQTTRA